jgi:hypothetical protein
MRLAPFAAAAFAAALLSGAASAQTAPRGYAGSVGSSWVGMNLNMQNCLQTTTQALTAVGYNVDPIGAGEETVFAGRDGDVIIIRCIPARQIAVIATHSARGQNMQEASRAVGAALRGQAPPAPAPTPNAPAAPATPGGATKF